MTERGDDLLREAWNNFCDELKQAGEVLYREAAASNPVDRAAGLRYLSRNIGLALQFELENNDPLHPEILHLFNPIRKQAGDHAEALNLIAPINGTDTYRVSGKRGTAKWFAVTVVETGGTPWGGGVVATLTNDEIKVEPDGTFEILLSPDPQPGNWMKTTPDTFRISFRQYFGDWENENPMEARIDRLTGDGAPPELTPEGVAKGLASAAHWLRWSTTYQADAIEKWKVQPNRFISYRQIDNNQIDATPGGEPLIAYWILPPGEAAIVRVKPPKCKYWSIEFGNYWWETMDYRYFLSSNNSELGDLEDDGELIVVIAHDDPGLPNWLDTCGHSEGYITYRWMGADGYPLPQVEQVKFADLDKHLPATAKRISAHERREQIAARRRGAVHRFKW